MQIQILSNDESDGYCCLRASCEKVTAFVGFSRRTSMVNVCVENAAHRALRGGGRSFNSFADAQQAYRSSEMKGILALAEQTFNPVPVFVEDGEADALPEANGPRQKLTPR